MKRHLRNTGWLITGVGLGVIALAMLRDFGLF